MCTSYDGDDTLHTQISREGLQTHQREYIAVQTTGNSNGRCTAQEKAAAKQYDEPKLHQSESSMVTAELGGSGDNLRQVWQEAALLSEVPQASEKCA